MKKRILLISMTLIMLMMLVYPARTSSISIMLDAALPVRQQAEALFGYIKDLSPQQQTEWSEELRIFVREQQTGSALPQENGDEHTVFITDSGERYHRQQDCWGLRSAKRITPVTRDVAIQMGRTPCKICYPNGDRP